MKRYYTPDIVFGPVSEDEEVHSVYKASEVQALLCAVAEALLRAVAEEVKRMAHGEDCPAVAGCRLCGLHPDEIFHNPRAKTTLGIDAHEFAPGDCECPRGKVLALLEVK